MKYKPKCDIHILIGQYKPNRSTFPKQKFTAFFHHYPLSHTDPIMQDLNFKNEKQGVVVDTGAVEGVAYRVREGDKMAGKRTRREKRDGSNAFHLLHSSSLPSSRLVRL